MNMVTTLPEAEVFMLIARNFNDFIRLCQNALCSFVRVCREHCANVPVDWHKTDTAPFPACPHLPLYLGGGRP